MPRGADLSKSLSEKETRRIRTLLEQNPQITEAPIQGTDFPKMMFGLGYLDAEAEWRDNVDPLVKKVQAEKMKKLCRTVWDEEEETELLEDGWKPSPADFLSTDKDPRIPRGVEGRRAALQKRLTVKEEMLSLRRRLSELEALEAAIPKDVEPMEETRPTARLRVPPKPPRRGGTAAHV